MMVLLLYNCTVKAFHVFVALLFAYMFLRLKLPCWIYSNTVYYYTIFHIYICPRYFLCDCTIMMDVCVEGIGLYCKIWLQLTPEYQIVEDIIGETLDLRAYNYFHYWCDILGCVWGLWYVLYWVYSSWRTRSSQSTCTCWNWWVFEHKVKGIIFVLILMMTSNSYVLHRTLFLSMVGDWLVHPIRVHKFSWYTM